jgi:nitrate/nitrite transport system permease protein
MSVITLEEKVEAPVSPPSPVVSHGARGRSRALALLTAVLWGLVGFAVLVGIWTWAASTEPNFPTPSEAYSAFTDMVSDPFYDNGPDDKGVGLLLQATLTMVFKGFLLASLVAVPLGLVMGTSRRVWEAVNPVVQVLKPVSPLAWFPLFLVLFKDVPKASVWVIFLIAMWPIVLNTAAGAAAVPSDQRDVAKVFRFSRLAYLRHVVVPHTLPQAVTGMRISMGLCWMVIVAVEMLGGNNGIGRAVWDFYNGLRYDQMVAAIFIIGLTGLILDLLLMRLSKAVALEEV